MLELKNVSFSVTDNGERKEIIKDVSLTVESGKIVVITGPNGGGKSTLARLIMGIEKPSSGRIFYNGEDVTDLSVTERAKAGVSFAFQQPVKFKGLKVLDLLRLASGRKLSTGDACEYLSAVGLCARNYIDRELNASLSGGELKRVEIAEIIARNSRLSIFDEPEAGIDLWSFANLIKVFDTMKKKNPDGAIVIISHQERILNIADEIVVIKNGRVDRTGSKEEILPSLMMSDDFVGECPKNA
ncbi:MAG: ATP-binding cassette domain-containing protein [Clostridia bacterium]|nr:ATP-binding cassette domain-containing protein [Clostridia bacterium]